MGTLSEDNKAARDMGLTYGKYKAMLYLKEQREAPPQPHRPARRSRRRYTDEQVFVMWQEGMNDCEIGAALGVSRQVIQKWRDNMELPTTIKHDIDTTKYHLVRTSAGIYAICGDEG